MATKLVMLIYIKRKRDWPKTAAKTGGVKESGVVVKRRVW
jgi:hypothetical protein